MQAGPLRHLLNHKTHESLPKGGRLAQAARHAEGGGQGSPCLQPRRRCSLLSCTQADTGCVPRQVCVPVVQAEEPLLADAQAVQLHLHSICQVACNAAWDEAVQALVQAS